MWQAVLTEVRSDLLLSTGHSMDARGIYVRGNNCTEIVFLTVKTKPVRIRDIPQKCLRSVFVTAGRFIRLFVFTSCNLEVLRQRLHSLLGPTRTHVSRLVFTSVYKYLIATKRRVK